jgi:hypothetical protein
MSAKKPPWSANLSIHPTNRSRQKHVPSPTARPVWSPHRSSSSRLVCLKMITPSSLVPARLGVQTSFQEDFRCKCHLEICLCLALHISLRECLSPHNWMHATLTLRPLHYSHDDREALNSRELAPIFITRRSPNNRHQIPPQPSLKRESRYRHGSHVRTRC